MTAGIEFAQRQVRRYRAALDHDLEELARLADGLRHFDQLPGQSGMVETTEQRRSEKLAHVELIRELIRLYERDIAAFGRRGRSE